MARKKQEQQENETAEVEDFTTDLISALNRELGHRAAYNLGETTAPTVVKRWFDTGSVMLNYAIRNAAGGGYPEGRIIEISGVPSSGKSHLCLHVAAVVQKLGGLVVYVDTENAIALDKLKNMGIDVTKRFVYCDSHCTEEVFTIIESTILKAKQLPAAKNIPILVVWDSIAASSPKAEIDGEYDQNTVGLQARVISKGMRKITGVIGQNDVTLICCNQLRTNIGVMHGDPYVTPGGAAVPFHSSVRVRLTSGSPVKDKDGNVVGIHVIATIKKNKVGPPFKKCEFDIIFGRGIVEHEYLFDEARTHCDDHKVTHEGKDVKICGTGPWKQLMVSDPTTGEVFIDKKFYKSDFGDLMKDPQYSAYVMKVLDAALTLDLSSFEKEETSEEDE